jgi:hypothetical protein
MKPDWMKRCSGDNCDVCLSDKGIGDCLEYNSIETKDEKISRLQAELGTTQDLLRLAKIDISNLEERNNKLNDMIEQDSKQLTTAFEVEILGVWRKP